MAGNGDDSGRADGQKVKSGIRSMFTKPKNKPTKTSEQSALSHRFNKLSTNQKKVDKAGTPDVQSTSGPGQPATSSKDSFLLSAVDKASATSHTVSSPSPTTLKPISELWNEAYEELKQKEDRLMKDYEAAMPKDITLMLASTSLTLAAPQVAVVRREQMAALLEKKTAEAKKNAWKLT
jgi:hypothetical protein